MNIAELCTGDAGVLDEFVRFYTAIIHPTIDDLPEFVAGRNSAVRSSKSDVAICYGAAIGIRLTVLRDRKPPIFDFRVPRRLHDIELPWTAIPFVEGGPRR